MQATIERFDSVTEIHSTELSEQPAASKAGGAAIGAAVGSALGLVIANAAVLALPYLACDFSDSRVTDSHHFCVFDGMVAVPVALIPLATIVLGTCGALVGRGVSHWRSTGSENPGNGELEV